MLWVDHLASRYHVTLGSSLSSYLDSGVSPTLSQWQHLAATYDGSTARFYVDGAQVASRTVSGGIGSSNTWRIGAYGSVVGGFFDGLIDELRVYNRALSAAEIVSDRDTPLGLADPTAPTTPGNLTVTGNTTTAVTLGWTASTDDVGVSGYNIYVGDVSVGTTTSTSFTVNGLSLLDGIRLRRRGVRHVRDSVAPRRGDGIHGRLCSDAGARRRIRLRRELGHVGRRCLRQRHDRRGVRRDVGDRAPRRCALVRRHRRQRGAAGTRHLLQHGVHARGVGAQGRRQEGRRHRRHLGRKRPDALDRPCRRPPLPDARKQLLELPGLGGRAVRRPLAARRGHLRRRDCALLRQRNAGRDTLLRQSGQLEHVADRSLRRHGRRILRRADRRRPSLRPGAQLGRDPVRP